MMSGVSPGINIEPTLECGLLLVCFCLSHARKAATSVSATTLPTTPPAIAAALVFLLEGLKGVLADEGEDVGEVEVEL